MWYGTRLNRFRRGAGLWCPETDLFAQELLVRVKRAVASDDMTRAKRGVKGKSWQAVLLGSTALVLLGCASSSNWWNPLVWDKPQEFRAPPPGEQRYQEPPTLTGLPRRDNPLEVGPRNNRDVMPAGPYSPPLGRPSSMGAIR